MDYGEEALMGRKVTGDYADNPGVRRCCTGWTQVGTMVLVSRHVSDVLGM